MASRSDLELASTEIINWLNIREERERRRTPKSLQKKNTTTTDYISIYKNNEDSYQSRFWHGIKTSELSMLKLNLKYLQGTHVET